MKKTNNIIYIDYKFHKLTFERRRRKLILVAYKTFQDWDQVSKWLSTYDYELEGWPDELIDTYSGYCLVIKALERS